MWYLLHLPENDFALAADAVFLESGVLEDVGEDVKGLGDILVGDLGIIGGLLPGGVGVEVSSHVLDLFLELTRVAPLGALEDHVLEEVRGAVSLLGLEPRPGVDPDADGGGAGAEGGLGGDAEAVGERGHARLGGGEDARVVREGRPGGPVLEEAGVGVLEQPELGLHGLGSAVIDHGGGGRRGGRGGGGGGHGGGGGEGSEGGEGGGPPVGAAGRGKEAVEGHGLAPRSQSGLGFHGGREIANIYEVERRER